MKKHLNLNLKISELTQDEYNDYSLNHVVTPDKYLNRSNTFLTVVFKPLLKISSLNFSFINEDKIKEKYMLANTALSYDE